MKRQSASRVPQEEKSKSSRNEERAIEERRRRRREWLIKQELDRQHEKMKKKRILEYEMERARKLGLSVTRSKNKSKSPSSQHRRTPPPSTSKQPMLEKVKGTTGMTHMFKGSEGIQISTTELQRIKINISRNIPGRATSTELQRDIINPEDVIVKRREGEGSKPIFERDELKQAAGGTEVEEYRKVISIDNPSSEDRVQLPKQCSMPSSPLRSESHSPQRTSSWNIRYEDSKYEEGGSEHQSRHTKDRGREYKRGESKESSNKCKDKDSRRDKTNSAEGHSREHIERRQHSRSRDREQEKWERDSHRSYRSSRDERSYRERSRERFGEHRERSRERFGEHRERSREQRLPPPYYIEQVPIPVYYGNFQPRPLMVGHMPIPFRGPVPIRRSGPPVLGPVRTYSRFIPSNLYRSGPPPNPRFGPLP